MMLNRQKWAGFTLLELMMIIVIIGIMMGLAIMAYRGHIYKSHRTEAIHTLLAIQLAEERYRSNNALYGNLTQVWNGVTVTAEGYYTLTTSNLSGTSYTITATAVGDQANDAENGTSCATMALSVSSGSETKTPADCWLSG